MTIYVKYDGIPGDATADHHKGSDGWWQANSFNFGASRAISTPTGSAVDRVPSAAALANVIVSKPQNAASTDVFAAALKGGGKDCFIEFVQDGQGTGECYMKVQLFDTMIANYSVASGGDRPLEILAFDYAKIQFDTTDYTVAGDTGSPKKITYNIATNNFE